METRKENAERRDGEKGDEESRGRQRRVLIRRVSAARKFWETHRLVGLLVLDGLLVGVRALHRRRKAPCKIR